MKRQDIGFAASLILFLLLVGAYLACIFFALAHGIAFLNR